MTISADMKVAGGLLALALAFGGAGLTFPLLQMTVGLAAIAAAAYFVLTRRSWHLPRLSRAAIAILACALLLPLLQIVPLPPALWTALPGRGLPMEVDAILGQSPWRPLSLDVEATLHSFLVMIPASVVFVALLFLSRAERMRLMWIVLGFALLGAAIGIIQATSGGWLTIFPSGHKGFATGLFVNRNHNAALLLVAMPIAAGLAATQMSRGKPAGFWMVAALSAMILLSLGILGTTSRMGLALLPLSIIASLILLLYRRAGSRAVAAVVASLALVTVLLAAAGRIDRVLERFSGHEDLRLTFWTDVRWALDYYGLWGTGFGTFEPVFKSAESLELIIPQTVNHAHNDFLEIALEGGWPALVLLVAFLVVVLVGRSVAIRPGTRRAVGQHDNRRSGIAILLVASLVDYPLRMPALSCVLALFVALLMPSSESHPAGSTAVALPASGSALWRAPTLLALAGIAALGILTIQSGASAFYLLNGRVAAAAAWAPWSTQAQVELASAALIRNDLEGTVAHGERAIALSPISAPAIRSVGLARLVQGRMNEGNRLMQAATVFGWRDPLTQLWAIEAAQASNEPEKAVQRAEALFRQDEFVGPATTALLATRATEQTVPVLAKALAANPPWRENFFEAGDGLAPAATAGWLRLVATLGQTAAPVTPFEGAPAVEALIALRRVAEAQALWRLLHRDGQLLSNGDFEVRDPRRDATRPALWRVPTKNRQLVRVEDAERGSPGKALHIRGSQADQLIEQRLLLPAGHYELRFRGRSGQPLDTHLQWQIACGDEGPRQRVETMVSARSGWRDYRLEFTVPNQDCPIQTLALKRAGDTSPEEVWLDSIRLTRRSD